MPFECVQIANGRRGGYGLRIFRGDQAHEISPRTGEGFIFDEVVQPQPPARFTALDIDLAEASMRFVNAHKLDQVILIKPQRFMQAGAERFGHFFMGTQTIPLRTMG